MLRKLLLGFALVSWLAAPGLCAAQAPVEQAPGERPRASRSQLEDLGIDLGIRRHGHDEPAPAVPRHAGQEILGALQEVIGLLLADPATDWSTISVARLREHLVDLDRVMVDAEVEESAIEGGLGARVTGDARTLEAARRIIPEHAATMDGFRGWRVSAASSGDALEVRVVAASPGEIEVIRALGFFGLLASGVHHPHRLLAVARGR